MVAEEPEFSSAQEAIDFIEVQRAIGLTPVMHGTTFYRHSFGVSQFGSYLYYMDERGTRGACQFKNVTKVFDFINLGQPVPGSLPDLEIVHAPQPQGLSGLVVAFIPGRREPTLLEAATAALKLMPAGAERDDLELAILSERRTH